MGTTDSRPGVQKTPPKLNRRHFAQATGAGAVAFGLGLTATQASLARSFHENSFRFVFLPDIHLMKDRKAPQGMAAALQDVQKLDPQPAFLVTGGDLIDSLRMKNLDEANELADMFVRIWSDNTELPVHHMLGNHDPAGWSNEEFPREHPDFGYGLLQNRLKLPKLFYSFDYGEWHFVILHNIRLVEPGSYVSEFNEEQMEFLKQDLANNPNKPTILFGHFPPITATEFLDGRAKHEEGTWKLSSQRMSRNPFELIRAVESANVKAFLSNATFT